MSGRLIKEVALREVRTRGRTKAFGIITAILILAAIAGPIIAALWPDGDDDLREVTIGLVANVETDFTDQLTAFAAGQLDITYEDLTGSSQDEVDTRLEDGDIDLAIEPGPVLAWDEELDFELAAVVSVVFQQTETVAKGRAAGLSDAQLADLLSPANLGERFANESTETEGLRQGVAFVGLMAAFIIPQAFGQLTLMSVVEEKSTRVIEVLLSHIRPRTLLGGKLIGMGVLAVTQLTVIVAGLLASLLLTDAIDVPASVWRFVPILLLSVIGGLAVYTTVFALLGSLISRQEDAAQVMMPILIPMMAGYIVGQTASFGNASSLLAKILTFVPLTTPMLLPVRVARDAISAPAVVIALLVMVVTVWVLLRIAGRVYEFTLLHTGSRVGWGELIRLSRGSVLD